MKNLLILLCNLTKVIGFSQPQSPYAWCIVPFDSQERSPEERIKMLKELGLTTYAYDWREKHLAEMQQEFRLAQENGININAVWMWIDPKLDDFGKLSSSNEQVLNHIKAAGLHTTIWMSFHPGFFTGISHSEAVRKAAEMVFFIYNRCKEIGCALALYNHGDWFGNPLNQIEIIRTLGLYEIGLVYSFHHGHSQIKDFDRLVREMTPFLVAVNLNGMTTNGPQIYPLGKGESEKSMLSMLLNAGYKGPLGILGHREDQDVQLILQENLEGYYRLTGLTKNQ